MFPHHGVVADMNLVIKLGIISYTGISGNTPVNATIGSYFYPIAQDSPSTAMHFLKIAVIKGIRADGAVGVDNHIVANFGFIINHHIRIKNAVFSYSNIISDNNTVMNQRSLANANVFTPIKTGI